MAHQRVLLLSFIWLLFPELVLSKSKRDSWNSAFSTSNLTTCRCFPGDECWPTYSQWNEFNLTVGGRLIATVPLAAPCHGDLYNATECTRIRAAWHDPAIHIQSSSSITAPGFANLSCDPFLPREDRCIVGTYVRYAVDARSVSDYKTVLQFATTHNIRLVIRNTAHDFLGKSTGAGALALWTHNLKNIDVLDYEKSYYRGKALKVSAGIQLFEAYQTAHDHGLTIVGGTCPTVGLAGGYTQGTGHGLAASKLGFGADQALEWEVMTVDGDILLATPQENTDLYWALSGGGGGTYGIVVSLTIKAHPDRRTAAANLTWTNEGISQDTFYDAIQQYIAILPTVLDAGGNSNWLNSNDTFQMSPAVGFGMSKEEIDILHEPLLRYLDDLVISYSYYSADFPTYLDMYNAMNPPYETAEYQIGSRLIPRTVIVEKAEAFTAALRRIAAHGTWISGVSFNVSRLPTVPNSVNPAFRSSSVSLVIGTVYNSFDQAQNLMNQELMTNTLVPTLAELIPRGGHAYLNEGDPFEPNWQQVFYGDNYPRLLKIKEKYDPRHVLYGRTAVGSEVWIEMADGRLCRQR
ncbi:putative alcohol oxidase [Biscogniauxia mediterranea]|nr:putative alcohol oxidase [Biscogniauxia mediterranea]